MNTFLKTYRLALTPLSPIHIGCGEDFEPTNYVIDDGVLYGFDPSRAVLNEQDRKKLLAAANSDNWLDVSRFFRDNSALFKPYSAFMIPVSSGVAKQYEDKLGVVVKREQRDQNVLNKLELERTQYSGITLMPYIPGSSFKGAIRTAILDALNQGRKPFDVEFKKNGDAKSTTAMEKRLFNGDFQTSPLRLLKVADLMPAAHYEPARRVMFGVNRKKRRQVIKDGREMQPKGIAARKECILHGQFRAFEADAVLPSLDPHTDSKTTPIPALRPADFKTIAKQSNAYNQTRLRREMGVLDGRGLVNPAWKHSIDKLMAGTLGKKLATGEAFLIRLGRYGGAESKTLSGDGVASIKIMGARVDGKQEFSFESTTKTVWLAAEQETDQKHLLPFGWAVVEIDPQEGDSPELKAWCIEQSKGRPDMAQIRQQFEEEKQAALTRKIELAALAAQREAARQAEQLAAIEREQALAEMTEQGRQIETLRHGCEAWVQKMPPHGNFKKQAADPGKAGLFQDASKLVTQALDCDWSANDKAALADMLETWLPQVIAPWDAKEQRKKLKFAALRGAV
jgi:CRISPR-associated protein Csm5